MPLAGAPARPLLVVSLLGAAAVVCSADVVTTKSGARYLGTVSHDGGDVVVESRVDGLTVRRRIAVDPADVLTTKSGVKYVGLVTEAENTVEVEYRADNFNVPMRRSFPRSEVASIRRVDIVASVQIDRATQARPVTAAEIQPERTDEEKPKGPLDQDAPSPTEQRQPATNRPPLLAVTDTYHGNVNGTETIELKIANHEDREVGVDMVSLDGSVWDIVGRGVEADNVLKISVVAKQEPVVIWLEVAGYGKMRFDMEDK